jgi:hypothetical protein
MTEYILYRTGKLLFPRLARDQRKHKMQIILLVLGTSLSVTFALVKWMKSGRY